MPLSPGLLRRVVAETDQATRVACCLASASARGALVHPDAWRRTTVYIPGPRALEFVRRIDAEHIKVDSSDVRRVERFLRGLHAGVKRLHLAFGDVAIPARHCLMTSISELGALEELIVECQCVSGPACLVFPNMCTGLLNLRTVVVEERPTARKQRKLEVFFGDVRLPCLEEVRLEVATSDILAHVRRFPRLDTVAYSSVRETYEDAALDGVRLTRLVLDVHSDVALHFLMAELARARFVDRLSLTCKGNTRLETYVNVRHIAVHLRPPARRAEVVHATVRGLASVAFSHADSDEWTVCFEGAGSWSAFRLWLFRTDLNVGLGGRVEVQP